MKRQIKQTIWLIATLITGDALGYFGQPTPNTSATNTAATMPTFITPPKISLFGDQDLADASWDKIDFSTPDFGTAQPANPNDPFGFPNEDLLVESSSNENYR